MTGVPPPTRNNGLIMLWKAAKGICHYCDCLTTLEDTRGGDAATKDHKIPRKRTDKGAFRGGVKNLVLACQFCNGLKGDLTDTEFLEVFPEIATRPMTLRIRRRLRADKTRRLRERSARHALEAAAP